MITIALPKGRIGEDTLNLFETIFNKKFKFKSRKLILEVEDFKFLLVRNQDVPSYVLHGAADLGIVGLDVLEESGVNLLRLLDLKLGQCNICLGYKKGEEPTYDKQIIVATKMVNIAKKYFDSCAIPAKIIKLYGSIELAPLVGLSDIIVDIVETGATMKENGLEVGKTIMSSSAYLVGNKNSFVAKKDEILEIYNKLSKIIN